LMNSVSIITALLFVLIFCQMVQEKSLSKGIKLGVLVGLLVGISMGIGSFSYMPITVDIAIGWTLVGLIKYTLAGAIVGKVVTTNI
jgi:Na+/H+ antiporter NhaA